MNVRGFSCVGKRGLCLSFVICHLAISPVGAQQRARYEFERNLPVYADSLIADLDYPLAWENSGIGSKRNTERARQHLARAIGSLLGIERRNR